MKFEFEGIDGLIQQMQRTEINAEQAKNEALEESAKVMQKATEDQAPVRDQGGGTLRDNIEISEIEDGEIQVYVDQQGKAYYGYFLEYGTSKMRAQPFMGPAFMKSRLKMQQAMADSLRKRIGLV